MSEEVVNIPVSQLQQLQSQAAEAERHRQAAAQSVAEAETRLALSRGEISAVTARHQAELQSARNQAKALVAKNALTGALAKHQLGLGSVEQLSVIWSKEVEVDEQDGQFAARTRDFQPVDKWVAEQLAKPAWSHFLATGHASAPSHGTPGQPGQQPAARAVPFAQPATLGEHWVNRKVAAGAQPGAAPPIAGGSVQTDDGRIVPMAAKSFGLKPLPR
jgi:hypothetical protein